MADSNPAREPQNLTRKLIAGHLLEGDMAPGREIALRVDQILTHDANGPLCALELEAMGLDDVKAELAVAYNDHLLLQADHRNADDHRLLESAARRFGMWYAPPGTAKPWSAPSWTSASPRPSLISLAASMNALLSSGDCIWSSAPKATYKYPS